MFVQEYSYDKSINDQLHCGHICAATFLAFSGQLRTTGAEDFYKRERGGERGGQGRGEREGERERERERETERERDRERERQRERETERERDRERERQRDRERERESIMSAEDNGLNTTFRKLGLSKQRRCRKG